MKVPFFQSYIKITDLDKIKTTISSNKIDSGDPVAELEFLVSKLAGRKYCIAVCNETIALNLILHSFKIYSNFDKIVIPTYGNMFAANAFRWLNCSLIPIDIDMDGHLALNDREIIKYTERGIPVYISHFSGNIPMSLFRLKRKKKWDLVIEDASFSLGNEINGNPAGSFGMASMISFAHIGIITSMQGAVVLTDDENIANYVRQIINQGGIDKYGEFLGGGLNFRFNELLALFILPQLKRLDNLIWKRNRIHNKFCSGLENKVYKARSGISPLHNIVFTEDSHHLVNFLTRKNIGVLRYYKTLNQYPAYYELSGDYPISEWWTKNAIYLPYGNGLTMDQVDYIINCINESPVDLINPREL